MNCGGANTISTRLGPAPASMAAVNKAGRFTQGNVVDCDIEKLFAFPRSFANGSNQTSYCGTKSSHCRIFSSVPSGNGSTSMGTSTVWIMTSAVGDGCGAAGSVAGSVAGCGAGAQAARISEPIINKLRNRDDLFLICSYSFQFYMLIA